ncbi:MAG: RDD family protein [Rickettsia endosymbiont of Glossina mortisans submortisans]|nr:RDD family protein [Rickettsia endosymbiont of Glossina mortisans submortisans]
MQSISWEIPEKITALHAWRRWAARTMDYIIYAIVIYLVLEILKIKNISYAIKILEFWQGSVFEGYITGMLLVIISMLINTIFIYCFGNTLGKRICGIKIVNINNLPYSFSTLSCGWL